MSTNFIDTLKKSKEKIKNIIATDAVKQHRLSICNDCENLIKFSRTCSKCGCFVNAKSSLKTSSCPIDKW